MPQVLAGRADEPRVAHRARIQPGRIDQPGRIGAGAVCANSVVAPTQIDAPFAAGCDPGLFGYLLIEFLTLEPSFFALRFVICFRFAGSGVLRGWDESRAWVLWVLVRMLGALSVKSV